MQETQPFLHASIEENIGLIDVLITVVKNAKLLIFAPLTVGLLALGLSFFLPQNYESIAVLQADSTIAGLMTTAAVLDPVASALGLGKGVNTDQVRSKLRQDIKPTIGRADKLLTLSVSASTPEKATALANAVLEQTYLQSRPKGSIARRIEAQLTEVKLRQKSAEKMAANLLKRMENTTLGNASGSEAIKDYAELLVIIGSAQTQISTFEAELEGVGPAALVQAPTTPQEANSPHKGLIAAGAALFTGLLLLMWIFGRQVLLNTADGPRALEKLTRLRSLSGLNKDDVGQTDKTNGKQ